MKDTRIRGQEKQRLSLLSWWSAVLGSILLLPSGQALASSDEVADWLNRAVTAAHQLNYKGTVSYFQHERSEFSRVTHYARDGKEYQRTETLNGPLRETIRIDGIIRCYIPDLKTMRVMPNTLNNVFPALTKNNIKTLLENYTYSKGETVRIAGRAAQGIVFFPKDSYRYEQKIWIDKETGLLLAGRMIESSTRRDLERFVFVDIEINIPPPKLSEMVWPDLPNDWKIEQTGFDGKKNVSSGWHATALPPGFSKIAEENRRFIDRPEPTVVLVYSDGLVSVSVFIEQEEDGTPDHAYGEINLGFLTAYTRQDGRYLITAVGQAPHDTLRLIAQGLVHK